jgi:hypothetical protein
MSTNALAILRKTVDAIQSVVNRYKAAELTRAEAEAELTVRQTRFTKESSGQIPLMGVKAILDTAEKEMAVVPGSSYDDGDYDSSEDESSD